MASDRRQFVHNVRRLYLVEVDLDPCMTERILGLQGGTVSHCIGADLLASDVCPEGAPGSVDILLSRENKSEGLRLIMISPMSKDDAGWDDMPEVIASIFGKNEPSPSRNRKGFAISYEAEGKGGRSIHFLFDLPKLMRSRSSNSPMFSGILIEYHNNQ